MTLGFTLFVCVFVLMLIGIFYLFTEETILKVLIVMASIGILCGFIGLAGFPSFN